MKTKYFFHFDNNPKKIPIKFVSVFQTLKNPDSIFLKISFTFKEKYDKVKTYILHKKIQENIVQQSSEISN